ncbi:MAG: hypothetical protein ACREFR_09055 [Limisphaerales bacterium]
MPLGINLKSPSRPNRLALVATFLTIIACQFPSLPGREAMLFFQARYERSSINGYGEDKTKNFAATRRHGGCCPAKLTFASSFFCFCRSRRACGNHEAASPPQL